MAILKYKASADADYTSISIKSFPDIGAAPNMIECTTLSDEVQQFVEGVKLALDSQRIKLINPSNIQSVKNIAISAGAGGSFIDTISDYDVDLYITGDVKFHAALEVEGFAVADIGHFESELPVLPLIQGLIAKTGVETMIAREQVPWTYI